MNYGFFDAANENHQATLLSDSRAAAAAGSRQPNPSAAQLDGMEVSTCAMVAWCASYWQHIPSIQWRIATGCIVICLEISNGVVWSPADGGGTRRS
jgi:hypothetical protein